MIWQKEAHTATVDVIREWTGETTYQARFFFTFHHFLPEVECIYNFFDDGLL